MTTEKTEIVCAYCGSMWIYGEEDKCPNCAASPDIKQIEAARKKAAKQAKQKDTIATGGIIGWVASRFNIWLIAALVMFIGIPMLSIIVSIIVPPPSLATPQIVENVEIVDHTVGEEIEVVEYLKVKVSEPTAILMPDSSLSPLMPDEYCPLLIKISAQGDGEFRSFYSRDADEYMEFSEAPYIIADGVAYKPVSKYRMEDINISEPELKAIIDLERGDGVTALSGYLCYFVPKTTKSCTINFESKYQHKGVYTLDKIHSVDLEVKEVSAN